MLEVGEYKNTRILATWSYVTPTMFVMICCYSFMCMYEKIEWITVSWSMLLNYKMLGLGTSESHIILQEVACKI